MVEPSAVNTNTVSPNFDSAGRTDHANDAEKLHAALDVAAQTSDVVPKSSQQNLNANAPSNAPNIVLGEVALNAADDAWVNVVALTEELHRTDLSPGQRANLLGELAQNWQTFQQESGPILREVENLIAKG